MKKYKARTDVEARKITDKDGERVVTDAGPVHVPHGSYVVQEKGVTRVQDAETFERDYTSIGGGGKKKKPAKKSAAPAKKSEPKTQTARERVAAKKATAAKKS